LRAAESHLCNFVLKGRGIPLRRKAQQTQSPVMSVAWETLDSYQGIASAMPKVALND